MYVVFHGCYKRFSIGSEIRHWEFNTGYYVLLQIQFIHKYVVYAGNMSPRSINIAFIYRNYPGE